MSCTCAKKYHANFQRSAVFTGKQKWYFGTWNVIQIQWLVPFFCTHLNSFNRWNSSKQKNWHAISSCVYGLEESVSFYYFVLGKEVILMFFSHVAFVFTHARLHYSWWFFMSGLRGSPGSTFSWKILELRLSKVYPLCCRYHNNDNQ